jgi:multimeric flavodoxin WrbA
MMKVLVLEGSPRQGNTACVLDWVIAGLGRGVKAERVRVGELDISGCVECLTCAKSKQSAGCAQDDDMVELYDKMVDADLVIWASPIFCWNVTAQTKTVLDRTFALMTGEDLLKGSKWALVLTAGGDHFDGADLAVRMFSSTARYVGVKYLGQHVVANCPGLPGLRKNRLIREQATAYGRELARQLKEA